MVNQENILTEQSLAQTLLTEIQVFYPEVVKLSIAKTEQVSEDAPANQQILLVKLKKTNKKPAALRDTLTTWAKTRLQNDNLIVLINPVTAATTPTPTP